MGLAEPAPVGGLHAEVPSDEVLRVDVVWDVAPHDVRSTALRLPSGACAADALKATGWWAAVTDLSVGVWGRSVPLHAPLRNGDRVEVYRPLVVDPKEARRLRYRETKPRSRAGRPEPRLPRG